MTCPICDNKPPNCDCTERERWQHEEIERLTAEVERHRMTQEERAAVAWASREAEEWANENDDEHDQTHGERALALRAFLERTAPKRKEATE